MKINSAVSNYRSNTSNQAFRAKFTYNTNEYFKNLGYHYLTKYGEKSDEFSTYKNCIHKLKTTCEKATINISESPHEGALAEITAPGSKPRIARPNNGNLNLIYLIELLSTLYKFETEYNIEQNPKYLDKVIDNILQK